MDKIVSLKEKKKTSLEDLFDPLNNNRKPKANQNSNNKSNWSN